ncbi:MAG: DMT family transporter [Propionibacteriaceae bacterium]
MITKPNQALGYVLVTISAACFGLLPLWATWSRSQGMPVIATLFWRFLLAAAIFLPYAIWRDRRRLSARALVATILLGLIVYTCQAGLYFFAIGFAGPALATVLLYLYPIFVCLGAVLLRRQQWSWWIMFFLAVAMFGIALTVGKIAQASLAGVLVGVACGLSYAIYMLIVDQVATRVPSRTMAAIMFSSAAVDMGVIGAATGQIVVPGKAQIWLIIVGLAVVSTIGGVWLLYAGMPLIGPTHASLVSMTEAVVALIVSTIFLDVRMTLLQWIGAALVIAAAIGGMTITLPAAAPSPLSDSEERADAGVMN